MPAKLRVVGLAPIMRDLRNAGRDLPPDLRGLMDDLTREVAAKTRARAGALGSTWRHVAPGVVARGSSIVLNTNSQPAILGAEFGGQGRPATMQFAPFKRGTRGNAGYMLYPTLYDEFDRIEDDVWAIVDNNLDH